MSTPLLHIEYTAYIVDNWKISQLGNSHTARIYLIFSLFFRCPQAVRKNYPQFIVSYTHCKQVFTYPQERRNHAVFMLTQTLVFIVRRTVIHILPALSAKLCTAADGVFSPFAKNIHILATPQGTECGYLVEMSFSLSFRLTLRQGGSSRRGHPEPARYSTRLISATLRRPSARR